MKRLIIGAALFAPALTWGVGPFVNIDDTAQLMNGAVMQTNPKTIEYLSTGDARYPNPKYDANDEESEKYVLGKWFIKEPALTDAERELDNAQEIYEERRADLRSVFCESWDRTLCWDLQQLTFEREDSECAEDNCALSKTQTYRLHRQDRGATRTLAISRR